jgi:hypothetical protein
MMGLVVRIAGESAAIEQLEGLQLTLRSPKPFPPGQPLSLLLSPDGASVRLDARSIGSKRRDEIWFEVRVRLINLRKDAREALEHAWASIERG